MICISANPSARGVLEGEAKPNEARSDLKRFEIRKRSAAKSEAKRFESDANSEAKRSIVEKRTSAS